MAEGGGLVKVLLVGGTGRFGRRLARALVARRDVSLRLLVRPDRDVSDLAGLRDRWATVVEGDLSDESSLEAALDGVHTVISAVSGGPEVVVDGQLHLLRVARRQGVRRFVPSDYGADHAALPTGTPVPAPLAMRRQVTAEVEASGVPATVVHFGGFMEAVFSRHAGLFDLPAHRAVRWGSGEELLDLTAMDDAARWVADVALDPRAAGTRVQLAGDVMSFNGLLALVEELTGRPLSVEEGGPAAAWREALASGAVDPVLAQSPALQLWGAGHLRRRANSSYPGPVPQRARDFLALALGLPPPRASADAPLPSADDLAS
jgi:uncharacterized protein YbjT (DUF2867 family)